METGSAGSHLFATSSPEPRARQVISLQGSRVQRLWTAVTLRPRVAAARRRLSKRWLVPVRVFAAIPDLESPLFVYEVDGAAGVYARACLELPGGGRQTVLRYVLRIVMGCDPATGSIILVATSA